MDSPEQVDRPLGFGTSAVVDGASCFPCSPVKNSEADAVATSLLHHDQLKVQQDAVVKDQLKLLMQKPDAILELSAFLNLKQFIDLNGTPKEIAKFFTKSYRGYPEMCKLISNWLLLSGMSQTELKSIFDDSIMKMIMENFDAAVVDQFISEDTRSPQWLLELVKESKWRMMIYELSDCHRDCLFLNYCIQLISSTGYGQEIASLPSASTNFVVYNSVLANSIQKIFSQTELTFDSYMNKFCKLTGHSEHTYLYTQALLHAISEHSKNLDILRISEFIEEKAYVSTDVSFKENHVKQFKSIALKISSVYTYPSLARALSSLLSSSQPSPADVRWLYTAYHTPTDNHGQRPPARFIQKSAIFKILISHLFDPEYHLPSDFVHQYLWILSYASTVKDPRSIYSSTLDHFEPDLESVRQVEHALTEVHGVCQKNTFGTKLAAAPVDNILNFVHYPIIAACVMHWIEANLTDPHRIYTIWNTKSLPIYLGLWREIVFLHANQHAIALKTLVLAFDKQSSLLGSVEALSARKSMLEALVYLVHCNYVLPTIHQVTLWAPYSDQSLIKHFLLTLLPSIKPPFSIEFLEMLLPLLESVKLNLNEHAAILQPFKDHIHSKAQSEQQQNSQIYSKIHTLLL